MAGAEPWSFREAVDRGGWDGGARKPVSEADSIDGNAMEDDEIGGAVRKRSFFQPSAPCSTKGNRLSDEEQSAAFSCHSTRTARMQVEQLSPLLSLPPEIHSKILLYLDPTDVLAFARSCKACFKNAESQHLW